MATIKEAFQIALGHHHAGRLREAAEVYRQILAADPANAHAMQLLGVVAHQQGDHDAAAQWIGRAIELMPDQPSFHSNLGEVRRAQGRLDEAAQAFRQSLALDPNLTAAHNNLGNVLRAAGRPAEAAAAYREAIARRADSAEAHGNLGAVLSSLDDLDAAIVHCRRAIELDPAFAAAHECLAAALEAQGKAVEAGRHRQQALRLGPPGAAARSAVEGAPVAAGEPSNESSAPSILLAIDRPDQTLAACATRLQTDPNNGELYDILATALHQQGRGAQAVAAYRRAVELRPDDTAQHSNLLYALNFQPPNDAAALFAEHRAWAARHAEPLTAAAPAHPPGAMPERRLRVGYVSPHFRVHAVNYFIEPILLAHDHEQFEIVCYSDAQQPDAVTARLHQAADGWRDVAPASDEQLAHAVRDDAIDILVDLTGHIGGNRLLAFARKPAPIQVTYLGYQNTTGMSAMNYRLTDALADPPGATDPFYTERLVRLPRSFFCYKPADDAPPVTPLPALGMGRVTFGSFNNPAKITQQTIDAWLSILAGVRDSRLLVLAHSGGYLERHLHDAAQRRGIDRRRIELCDRRRTFEYLKLQARADVALDPFPFNGHTTTCDSLWMGLPVVTLQGDAYASRFGGTALANVGLERLITRSADAYVAAATTLAADLDSLARLRTDLRPRMASSPLFDFAGFTRNLEAAYRQMWRHHCEASSPQPA